MHKAWLAAAVLAAFVFPSSIFAADHQDGPRATGSTPADAAADITDVFAWTSPDGTKLNLVLDVFPVASQGAKFSDAVQYVFHTQSRPAFGTPAGATEDIVCTFDTAQRVSCWAGDEYVTGDGSNTAGIASQSGRLRVFAGLRDDPFFFNLDGFKHVAATVKQAAAAGALPPPDPAGCYDLGDPNSPGTTANTLVNDLMSNATGSQPAVDHFKGLNVLALVVQVDRAIVNRGGPIVSVWASTNRP